jgi:hypothetical protein
MALHTELPIYKHAYGLLRLSLIGKANMRRDFKNSLGTRIHDECIEVLSLIAEANAADDGDKPTVIRTMLRHVGKIEFLLRVCNDERLITTPVWAEAIVLLQAVGSQGGGWANYFQRKKKAPAV